MYQWLAENLGNVSVNRKLGIGFGLVLLLTLLITFTGWTGLSDVTSRGDKLGFISSINDLTKDLRIARLDYENRRGEQGPDAVNEMLEQARNRPASRPQDDRATRRRGDDRPATGRRQPVQASLHRPDPGRCQPRKRSQQTRRHRRQRRGQGCRSRKIDAAGRQRCAIQQRDRPEQTDPASALPGSRLHLQRQDRSRTARTGRHRQRPEKPAKACRPNCRNNTPPTCNRPPNRSRPTARLSASSATPRSPAPTRSNAWPRKAKSCSTSAKSSRLRKPSCAIPMPHTPRTCC